MKTKFSDLAPGALFKTANGTAFEKQTSQHKCSLIAERSTHTNPDLVVIPLYNVPVDGYNSLAGYSYTKYKNEKGWLHRLDGPAYVNDLGIALYYISGARFDGTYLEFLVAVEEYKQSC